MQREKRVLSGKLLDVDFFPVWNDGRRMPTRAPKTEVSSEAQAKYNHSQAVKKLVRVVNTNFITGDHFTHLTYSPEKAPANSREARRHMTNFLNRIKRRRASLLKKLQKRLDGLESILEVSLDSALLETVLELRAKVKDLSREFRYVYVVEMTVYKRGRYAGLVNYHFHAFMTGGLDASVIESEWRYGAGVNVDSFQPETFGPECAAAYLAKDATKPLDGASTRRIVCSKNIKKPKQLKNRDGKISRAGVEKMVRLHADDRDYWERRYPGYRFIRTFSRYNSYNGHWYLSVIMYRNDGPPPRWTLEDDDLWMAEAG